MKPMRSAIFSLAAAILCATAAWAQMGMGMRPPEIPGIFKPEVGSGAQYSIDTKGDKMEMAIAVVGKETVDGEDGYWKEIRILKGKGEGTIVKQLTVAGSKEAGIMRMIVQPPGRPPMELSGGMMNMMHMQSSQASGSGEHGMGEVVGTESITVPAGTFECQHYRTSSSHGPTDIWVSAKVSPMGAVKMTSSDTTMVLEKVLSNQTSQIKGEPMKMPNMMPH